MNVVRKIGNQLLAGQAKILPNIATKTDLLILLKRIGLVFRANPICEHHQSPFTFIHDLFFEKELNALVWACRGGGKSLLEALLTWLNSLYKPGCETRVLAGSFEQGQQVYEHTLAFWDKLPLSKKYLKEEPKKYETRLKNNSSYLILTASPTSVRGPHPHRLIIDELEEVPESIFNAALSQPQSTPGIPAGVVIASTLHKPQGLMQNLVENADDYGFKLYSWCYKEIAQMCNKSCMNDKTGKQCDLFPSCRGDLKRARGYYAVDDLIKRYRMMPRETWEAEWECKVPNAREYVWDPVLIRNSKKRCDYDKEAVTVMGIDWGFNHPTVVLIIQKIRDKVKVLKEYYWRKKLLNWRCNTIKNLAKEFKVQDIYADANDKNANMLLSSMGLNIHPFFFAPEERKASIDSITWYMEKGLLYIEPTCKNLLQEMLHLRFKYSEADRLKKVDLDDIDKVKKGDDHGCDALEAAFKHFRCHVTYSNFDQIKIKSAALIGRQAIDSEMYLTEKGETSWVF